MKDEVLALDNPHDIQLLKLWLSLGLHIETSSPGSPAWTKYDPGPEVALSQINNGNYIKTTFVRICKS